MKHLAAYLLLNAAGNSEPSVDQIKAVLASVGIDADEDRLSSLMSELQGKDINQLVSEGSEKLATVPSGGAAAAAAPAAAGAGAAAEEKKEEKKEEPAEESDEDMGFGLFD